MKRILRLYRKTSNWSLFLASLIFGSLLLSLMIASSPVHGQSPPITPSGLNTQVNLAPPLPGGKTQFDITGGTRPGGGLNLFHSFGDFNVPNNNIANFLNVGSIDLAGNPLANGLPTSNILGRVTGGNISNLFGTIQTTGFGNVNLFLMNPAGFLFGPNATVNVGGMVAFTSADYLRLADGVRFSALPNAATDALLSTSPVAAFGFLGSTPGAITVEGSQLSVPPGQSISLVGRNITIQSGVLDDGLTTQQAQLSAPGGQINLVSVASPGEALYPTLQTGPNVNGQSFINMGNIKLSQASLLDVSAESAGTIRIRGGHLVIADATISADSSSVNGAFTAVDIKVTGDISISDTRGTPSITARTTGLGDAGEVHLSATNIDATSNVESRFSPIDTHFALIDSHTSGSGRAGNISIEASNNVSVSGKPTGPFYFIDSGTIGPNSGNGGDITVAAKNISLQNTRITSGDSIALNLAEEAGGSGGNITITADSLLMNLATLESDGFFAGRAGNITVTVRNIEMNSFSQLSLLELEGGGALKITADRLIANSTQFESETVFGPGGGITIDSRIVELKNGTTLRSQTVGDGNAGDIRITATDRLVLSDDSTTLGARTRPTGLFTNSLGNVDLGNLGNAGSIVLSTPQLEVSGGARIDSTTQSSGRGGDVTITAGTQVMISGERPTEVIELGLFGLGSTRASGIYTRAVGSEFCTGTCGDAGHVSVTTGALNLNNGAVINSGTASTGRGGDATVHASETISISGTMVDGNSGGIFSKSVSSKQDAGVGGNITLSAGQSVSITNGASVSASSTGPGNAGNISINAGQQLNMQNGSVKTEAAQAGGGNIAIQAIDRVLLQNSTVSTSVLGGTGSGGNITIDPNVVLLQNSQILAQAVQGSGGNISITTNLLLPDATSVISASSEFGQSGTINIQSPISPAGGKIFPLSQRPLMVTSLLSQRCAALAEGEFSSFTVAGRDTLPVEPGSWLSSQFANSEFSGSRALETGIGRSPIGPSGDTRIFSLRQIAPLGFLTQAFAVDSAGCTS